VESGQKYRLIPHLIARYIAAAVSKTAKPGKLFFYLKSGCFVHLKRLIFFLTEQTVAGYN
jgi:hypothetical protein